MSFLKSLRVASASDRLVEEQIYEYVAKEIGVGIRRDGLWAKAVEKAMGDETKAKALYIQFRVQSLKDEAAVYAQRPTACVDAPINPIDAYDSAGHTALMRAVKTTDPTAVKSLLQQGADPTVTDSNFGTSTALSIARRALSIAPESSRQPLQEIIAMLAPLS
jgi:hypothetical protein